MSDWLTMEEKVSRTKAETKALGEQYLQWQPPRRNARRFNWLARLLHRRRPAQDQAEPPPVRPAFR